VIETKSPAGLTEAAARSGSVFASYRPWLLLLAAAVMACLLLWMVVRKAANTTLYGNSWDRSTFVFVEDVSHERWNLLLRKYVNEQGRVRYGAWKENEEDLKGLHDYLDLLSLVTGDRDGGLASRINDADLKSNHEKVFWINAHNAMVVKGILDVFPTATVRQHTNPIGFDFNEHLKLIVAGRAWSISEIASMQLPSCKDPRLRFAISGASADCPPLRNRAWVAERLDPDLDEAAAQFLNDQTRVCLDAGGVLVVPEVLEHQDTGWNWSLSGSWRELAGLIRDAKVQKSFFDEAVGVRFVPHDWSLNDQR
jgi:Protein of unknown function, DUF547